MLVADTHLGHRDDPGVAARIDDEAHHRVVLSDTDRKRSRVRTETVGGTDVGIVVGRDLGDGDVLETGEGALVVVELEAVDALVLDLGDADIAPLAGVELGHALGNRHWDLAVRGEQALFPVPDTRERMREQVSDHLPEGVEPRFETVPPTTFDDDHGHSHEHGGHAHGPGGHTHGDGGHTHGHEDSPPGVLSIDQEERGDDG